MRRPIVFRRPMADGLRPEFFRWLHQEPSLARLVAVLEWRIWSPDLGVAEPSYHRVEGGDLAALKAELIRRLEAAGGRVELGHLTLSIDGGALFIELPS